MKIEDYFKSVKTLNNYNNGFLNKYGDNYYSGYNLKNNIKCNISSNNIELSLLNKKRKFMDFEDDESLCSSNSSTKNSSDNKKVEAKFKLFRVNDQETKVLLQTSLYKALLVKGIIFCDDLYYPEGVSHRSMNNALLEPGMQIISEYNKNIYYRFKERTRNFEYPPLKIEEDEIQVYYLIILY